ncbi:hypothetical protein M1328_01030 [Patescibacteria group bacterium]|nr:hypothetical protein [Patescibacteria group bacterium]
MSQIIQIEPFSKIVDTFWGTFLGAFAALLFLPITNIISRIVKRRVQHYNSLVLLETQLNEMIGIIKDNIYLIPAFKKAIINGNIYWSLLRTIPLDKTHLTNLADIELINDVFEFFYDTRKINDDVENLNKGYDELKNAFIEKNITVEHYAVNSKLIAVHLELVGKFYDELLDKLIGLLTIIRIQIRRDMPLVVKIQEFFFRKTSDKISIKEFKEEKSKLEDELEKSSEKSRDEIAKVSSKKI